MKITDVPQKDMEKVPTTLRLSKKTREDIESLKLRFGKARVTEWLRLIVEESVHKEVSR